VFGFAIVGYPQSIDWSPFENAPKNTALEEFDENVRRLTRAVEASLCTVISLPRSVRIAHIKVVRHPGFLHGNPLPVTSMDYAVQKSGTLQNQVHKGPLPAIIRRLLAGVMQWGEMTNQ
jgi:hypothetical protein